MGSGIRFFWLSVLTLCAAGSFAQPIVTINDTQVIEGNSGTTNAVFEISLSAPYTNNVTVEFTTFEFQPNLNQPYPAHLGTDLVATNGIVTFEPGQTNKLVFVKILGDVINEANEPFGLGLNLRGQGSLARGYGQCTILDDDPLEIYINECVTREGAPGEIVYAPLTLTTYEATEQVVYCQSTLSAGSATSNVDYDNHWWVSWQMDPGPRKTNVYCASVLILGDAENEDDETFYLNPGLGYGRFGLKPKDTNPQNARGVVFLNSPKITIINDDFYLRTQRLGNNQTQVTLFGASSATHVVQSSSNLVNWTSFNTNTLDAARQISLVRTNSGKEFYRAFRVVNLSN